MALLEIAQSRQVTATISLDDKTAVLVDQYAAFVRASADEVINHALEYVFSKDRDFQEFLKSSQSGAVQPSLRVRKPPHTVSVPEQKAALTKKVGA